MGYEVIFHQKQNRKSRLGQRPLYLSAKCDPAFQTILQTVRHTWLNVMPSVVHCLGELEYIYDKYNLKLRTKGCVSLSFPRFFDDAFPSNVQDLDALISSGTCIAGSNQLRLHVELKFDDIAVTGSDIPQATEDVGVVICSAEVL